jgi:hypothetical protein
MPSLYIAEYEQISNTTVGNVLAPAAPPYAEQKLAVGAGAILSAALNVRCRFVRLHSDVICSVAFSRDPAVDPTATTSSQRLAANQTEYFGTVPGTKISVIANT